MVILIPGKDAAVAVLRYILISYAESVQYCTVVLYDIIPYDTQYSSSKQQAESWIKVRTRIIPYCMIYINYDNVRKLYDT